MRNTLQYNGTSYDGLRIKSAQAAVDTSLNERTLDVDTMTATVQSQTSLAEFSQNEPVYFLRGGSQYALWYLKEIKRVAPDLWTLSMMSSLGRLSQMAHKGGIYNGVSAGSIIDDICGVVPHFVGAAFADVLLYGYLPYVSPSGENGAPAGSAKDNLLKVLFAINATVRDDAQGTLRIENLSTAVSSTLDADRIYRDNAIVRHEPPVTSVTVLEHQYISGGEQTTLFEGTTTAGQVIVFREPMSDLAATGFSVLESGANYAIVSAGTGTLTGKKYIHTTREITRSVTAAPIPNPARIEDATLVGITNSGDVANRLAAYYAHRTYIECDATIEFEDAGDVVSILDPYDKVQRDACIEKISPLIASQTMKGRISALVGFTPWQVVAFSDQRELLTGSGTWIVPEGVTEVTVVLIGGGKNGSAGSNGTSNSGSATDSETKTGSIRTPDNGKTVSISASPSSDGGAAGTGGAGGAGGVGGKILRADLAVSPGQSYTFTCGAGNNSPADETSFGELSSASGARNAAGYFDPVAQLFFGVAGVDGSPGGNGGSPGNPGQTVGTVSGGAGATSSKGSKSDVATKGQVARFTVSASYTIGGVGGGGAGGSSGSNRGSAGGNAGGTTATFRWDVDASYSSSDITGQHTGRGEAHVRNLDAGSGGNGANGANGANYGCGGAGGGGGGGAGAPGSASLQATLKGENISYATTSYSLNVTLNASARSSYKGTAGIGGSGGAGAAGCIILYYRKPVTD